MTAVASSVRRPISAPPDRDLAIVSADPIVEKYSIRRVW
jgi:hypothetical protein